MKRHFLYRWFRSPLDSLLSGSRRQAGSRKLEIEQLEGRIVPSTVKWMNPNSGDWDVPGNWSTNSVPTGGDDVVINPGAAVTVTFQASDSVQVQSVTTAAGDTLSITGGSLTVTAGDSTLNGALSMTGGSLTASGSGVNLTANGSTAVSGAGLTAQAGATLSLPGLTSYTSNSNTFQADGSSSVLDVSALDSVTETAGYWAVKAANGGEVNLSSLTSLSGVFDSAITDTGSSTILDPKLMSIAGTTVTLDGSDAHVADSWTSFTNGVFTVTGGSYGLPGLTDLNGSSISVTGGDLTLTGLQSYTSDANTFQVDGTGSVLDVSALDSVTQTRYWAVSATDGGEVNLSSLTSLSGVFDSAITDTGGSIILDPKLTSIDSTRVTLDGTDAHVADSWASFTKGSLTITGGSYSLPGLTDVDGSTLSVTGGTVSLGGLTSTASTIFVVNGGASLTLPTGTVTIPTSAGAVITLPTLPQGSTLDVTGTFSGGTTYNVAPGDAVNLSGGSYTGGVTFNVGAGATLDLTGGQAVSYSGTLTGSGAGTVQFGNGLLETGLGGLTLNFPGPMFQWTDGSLSAGLGDVTNLGTINLSGGEIEGDGTLDNFGTIIQTGNNDFTLHSNGVSPGSTLTIERGALYLIESDGGVNSANIDNQIENAGTIRKVGGPGVSTLQVDGTLSNTGVIEVDSGTLDLVPTSIDQISGGTLTGGTWNALDGATLQFPTGTSITSNAGNIALGGTGATIAAIAGLTTNNGSFSLTDGADFTTTGDFTNSGSLTVGAGSAGGSKLTVAGNFTQTSAGAQNVQTGGTPTSGQFGQIAVHDAAALAGSFNLSLVNSFGPSAGQHFNVMSFASATGAFSSFTGLSPLFTESQTATALELNATTGSVDLAATSVTAPSTATSGQQITVNWQATDQSSQAATGSWQDSIYLSPTPTITGSSTLLGATTHTGGLAANASYSASWTGALPALPPGFYYVLVQIDSLNQTPDSNRANSILAANKQLHVSVPALTLGTPTSGTFTAAGQDQYYQVTVPAGGSLQVSLASASSSGALALYVSQGTEPTPYNYQEAAHVANQPNQTLTIPQVLTPGTYYILVHSVAGAAATANYDLTVTQTSALSVSGISSYSGGNAGDVTVEVDGANFTAAATATLSLGATTLQATAIDSVGAGQIFATFNLSGAAAGNYTLKVQQGAQSATAPTPFQVTAAAPSSGLLFITLTTPQIIRAGRTGDIVITYTNDTANDIVAPVLNISSTNAAVSFSTPDDPNDFVQSAEILAVAPSGPAGVLRPGQSGQITLALLNEDPNNGAALPVSVEQNQPGQAINWAAQKAALQPASFSAAAWNVVWTNLMATVGTTTDSLNAALAQAATYLGGVGETTAQVGDVSRLWSFLISQANASFPTAALASAVDASLPTPGGLALAIPRTFVSSIAGRYQQGIFGLGWTTPWQMSLSVDGAGNVSLTSGGGLAYFVAQPNGGYLDTDGEYGTLSRSGSIFTFTSTSGTQYVFLANGLLNYEQDTTGNRIALGYNAQTQIVTLTYSNPTDPSEPTEQLTLSYNGKGFVSQVADGTGNTWTYSYDSGGHLTKVQNPDGTTTTYTYDTGSNPETANALLSITAPNGSQQNFTYSPTTGRLTGASQNGGADPIAYAYPGEAEVTATDAAGDQSTVWFNDLSLAARTENGLGAISNYSYDANGNLISYADAVGDTYQYSYDANGNLTQSVNPLGQTVQMTYGALDTLTSLTDADGNTTQYQYNSAGDLLSITYPGGTQQSFTYDPLGDLSETVQQNGDPVGYQYNAQGLLATETFADGSSQTFLYDVHGNLTTAKTFNAVGTLTGTTTLKYNTAGTELDSITYPNGQFLDFTYNTLGQRIQSVDQAGYTVNYTYDALGRLAKLTDASNNLIVQYTYNSLGQLAKKINGNGTYTTYGYDTAGDLTSEINYANPGGTTINSSFTYTYNLLGEQTSVTNAAGNRTTYGYDALGQLTQVNMPGSQTITYVYNAAGDRTEVLTNGMPTIDSSNADNEITQVGSTTYTYDANGNLQTATDSSGTTHYVYNDLNQLTSIATPDGSVTTFQYSPLGFLVGTSVTSGGTTSQTNYLVDPTGLGNVVAAYNGSGSLIADYTYGLGLVSQTGPSGTGYYDFDGSGNAVGITGASGAYVNHYSYLPFGETTTISAALPNPFTFAGQVGVLHISANLFSMRARDYTPATGQFLSNDPIGLAGGDTNVRRYVANNPVSRIDPSGKDQANAWSNAFVGGLIGGVLGGFVGGVPGAIAGGLIFGYIGYQLGNPAGAAELSGGGGSGGGGSGGGGSGGGGAGGSNPGPAPIAPPPGGGGSSGNGGASGGSTGGTSTDPNALIGPTGFGALNFIQATGVLPYTIDFENDGSLAAQDVTVTEQLNPNLDWSTFQLGSFGFGTTQVAVPAGLTQYQTTVAYHNTDGSSLNVDLSLNFNVQTGLLTVTFTSLDPLTGQAPTGVIDGFLPPDNSSGIGEGYVQYTVQPKSGLATGATINQQAAVVFDTNAAIETNLVTNTIDVGAPTSSVAALPQFSPGQFTLNWSGSDDKGGSGIATYTIYESDNGGAFTPFLTNTTATSAKFTGQNGHTYAFYSVATDNVGNVQPTPSAAQTTTTVDTIAPTSSVNALLTSSPGTFTVSWTGNDGSGPGIASYSVYVLDNGSAFSALLTNTTQTSTSFTGVNGHTYGFYSIATDKVGNVQPTPTAAQATTAVVVATPPVNQPPVVNPISPQTAATDGNSTVSFTVIATAQASNGTPLAVTYSLGSGAPAGASINAQSGVFTWSPSEWNGTAPGVYTLTVTATETTAPQLASTANFTVTVGPSSTNQGSGLPARTAVAVGLTQSAEYYSNVIIAAYSKYLGRAPDANGLAYWLNLMQNQGLSDEHLEAGFIGSAEYIADHGGAGAGWVTGMYENLLGRTPAASEVQYWLTQLAAGESTSDIAYGFAASQERESQRVSADYQHYLGRSASATEVSYWVNVFLNGGSNEKVIAGFVSSQEYFQSRGNNIVDWLFADYRATLNREPDNAGYQYWLSQLQ